MTRETMEVVIWLGAVAVPVVLMASFLRGQSKAREARSVEAELQDKLDEFDPTTWNETLTIPEAINAGERLLS